ncbi:hypothetical protein V1520DRAFT_347397 [Lipomyces starkeyi]|uniref:MADS-box domain-containing protein n=1 Tax=Lipomyces starkeyi NRRL Y-11557 TaxID=675824 RepID=A0A1E3QGX8_LIPST|nr:hypothetical protein LIPSTDRAFT_192 [Lipomyces starkeyi NRRL Y-11557]
MGRRKILIKPLKDERNRSVTFLKRKAGLFKKAHELSVLCSVDIAVIIFGHNKKLYEFTSCDTRQLIDRYNYTTPHESKGPADFQKGSEITDDDNENDNENENENENFSENATPDPPESKRLSSVAINRSNTTNPLQQTPHLNVSPPRTKSGAHSRSHSHTSVASQTQGGNRSSAMPSVSASMHHLMPGTTQIQTSLSDSTGMAAATLASFPGDAFYTLPPRPQPQQNQSVRAQQVQLAQQQAYNFQLGFQFQNGQQFVDARPNTVPPQMPQFEYQVSAPTQTSDMRMPYRSKSSTSVPEISNVPVDMARREQPQPPSQGPNITIEPTTVGPRQSNSPRAQSVDVGSVARNSGGNKLPGASNTAYHLSSVSPPNFIDGGSLPSSATSGSNMRPKLKLRIPPDETASAPNSHAQKAHNTAAPSTDPSTAVSSSPASQDNNSAPPLSAVKDVSSPVVLLPPPSPSTYLNANSLGGPGNPFARPASLSSAGASGPSHTFPPATSSAANVNVINATSMPNAREQTPISALPSRYVSDLLPSPSTLYTPADWGLQFSAKNGMLAQDLLPSPLQFHTPVVSSAAQSFNRDRSGLGERETDGSGLKRRGWSDEDDGEGSEEKRIKT